MIRVLNLIRDSNVRCYFTVEECICVNIDGVGRRAKLDGASVDQNPAAGGNNRDDGKKPVTDVELVVRNKDELFKACKQLLSGEKPKGKRRR